MNSKIIYGVGRRGIFMALMMLLICGSASAASTAAGDINGAVGKYMRGSVTVRFTFSGAMGSGSGTLKSSGKRFALETSSGSVWYDGVNMWTYSPAARETTLVKPSAEEVAEANPLAVLSGAAGVFKASYAPKQTPGTKTIVMTPKKGNGGIKRVVVVLDASSLSPRKIDVTGADGGRTVLVVKSLVTGQKHAAGVFKYPAGRYKNVKVVDLR